MVVGSADAGFFDSNSAWVSTPATDISALDLSFTQGKLTVRGPGGLNGTIRNAC